MIDVSYMLPNCGVGGGPRVVLTHLNYLHDRGHNAQLFIVGRGPDWFKCRFPITVCQSYEDACNRMSQIDGIKVATWYETAPYVIKACEKIGQACYLVQDIETQYFPNNPELYSKVLRTYQLPWKLIIVNSPWTLEQLHSMNISAPVRAMDVPIDLSIFKPNNEIPRSANHLLYIARGEPLKNIELMRAALTILEQWKVPIRIIAFGVEPHLKLPLQERYYTRIADTDVATLYNTAFAYVSSSRHEGFGVPHLEAMACDCPVITTLADGNNHFCSDGVNCLTVEHDPLDLASTIYYLWKRPKLQEQLVQGGRETVPEYELNAVCSRVEQIYKEVL